METRGEPSVLRVLLDRSAVKDVFNLKIDPSFPRLASTMTSLFPGLYSSMTAPYPSRASPLCEHVLSWNVSVVTPFAKKEEVVDYFKELELGQNSSI